MFWFQAKGEEEIKRLGDVLSENMIDHKMWVEQPENYPTCLATKPYKKEDIQKYFKKFKLYR